MRIQLQDKNPSALRNKNQNSLILTNYSTVKTLINLLISSNPPYKPFFPQRSQSNKNGIPFSYNSNLFSNI